MIKLGASVALGGDQCKITRDEKPLTVGKLQRKRYFLILAYNIHAMIATEGLSDKQLWHNRFGHF